MKAVIVDGDVCYPATSGKRLRTLHLMLRMARRHDVTYIARCPAGPEQRQAAEYLGDHGIRSVFMDFAPPRKGGPLFYARLAANLLSPLPYSVASHGSALARQTLQQYAELNPVDVWQFEWPAYADALRGRKGVRTVIIAHNVDSLIWKRYVETEPRPLHRWYLRQQWRKYERFERRIYAEATRVVTCTADDAAIVRDMFGVPQVDVVDNGIDRAYFEAAQGQRDPHRILFLGALDYRPNADAASLLLDRIFPAVRAKVPAARLCVVGRNPSPGLIERVRGLENVELHANVADVRPYLAESGVMAVPLRIGGGSRLKILEALACGLPVVSTRVGAEGLCLKPGCDLVLVEEVDGMADALAQAVANPGPALEMAENGQRLVLERYDWDALADRLERVWEQCVGTQRVIACPPLAK
jgi:glycosyltransferase involved in cell wall biosynthesis